MARKKNKYKHVRVFLVDADAKDIDLTGSRMEYSVPTVYKDKYGSGISIKLTDCDRSIHWYLQEGKAGERKINKAITVLQQALSDLKAVSKLPEEPE